jgi:hypothetical protein
VVVGWAAEEESKRSCADDMSVNGEGDITNAPVEVLYTSEGARRAAIRTFHTEGALCIDLRTDFLCKVISDDYYLTALVQNACFCAEVVHEHINLTQRKGKLSFAFGCQLEDCDQICAIFPGLLNGAGFNATGAKVLDDLLADGWTGSEDMRQGNLVKLAFEDPIYDLLRQGLVLRTGLVPVLGGTGVVHRWGERCDLLLDSCVLPSPTRSLFFSYTLV